MTLDIATVRAHTPACDSLIHFNNAGAALSPVSVTNAVISHLKREQEIGGYEAATEAEKEIENFYGAFSRLLQCAPEEIAFAENATHAWNNLFQAIPFQPGDRIVTGQSEYASNYLAFLHLAQRRGVILEVIPNDSTGRVDLEKLESAFTGDVRLLALTHVPSQSGVIHPAQEAGQMAKRHGVLYLLDACQSAGQLALDVKALGCDMLTGTGRKYLRGPRGTGFLFIRQEILHRLDPFWIDLHSAQWTDQEHYVLRQDARRFENWECSIAGKIGLGVAVDYALNVGMPAIESRVQFLAQQLRDTLASLPGVTVHECGAPLSGIVTFDKKGVAATDLHAQLRLAHMNSSVARVANNWLDLGKRAVPDLNRASVHYYNTEEEIQRFCARVAAA